MITLAEIFGTNPATCGHEPMTGSTIYLVIPNDPIAPEDWPWAVETYSLAPDATSCRLCWKCQGTQPSETAKSTERMKQAAESSAKRNADQKAEWEAGANMLCPSCDGLFHPMQLVELRECPHCQEFFDGTENGRNCPSCNRPFSRKVDDDVCPECLEEDAFPVKVETMPDA